MDSTDSGRRVGSIVIVIMIPHFHSSFLIRAPWRASPPLCSLSPLWFNIFFPFLFGVPLPSFILSILSIHV